MWSDHRTSGKRIGWKSTQTKRKGKMTKTQEAYNKMVSNWWPWKRKRLMMEYLKAWNEQSGFNDAQREWLKQDREEQLK